MVSAMAIYADPFLLSEIANSTMRVSLLIMLGRSMGDGQDLGTTEFQGQKFLLDLISIDRSRESVRVFDARMNVNRNRYFIHAYRIPESREIARIILSFFRESCGVPLYIPKKGAYAPRC